MSWDSPFKLRKLPTNPVLYFFYLIFFKACNELNNKILFWIGNLTSFKMAYNISSFQLIYSSIFNVFPWCETFYDKAVKVFSDPITSWNLLSETIRKVTTPKRSYFLNIRTLHYTTTQWPNFASFTQFSNINVLEKNTSVKTSRTSVNKKKLPDACMQHLATCVVSRIF